MGRGTTTREIAIQASARRWEVVSWAPRAALLGLAGAMMVVDLYLVFMWAPVAGAEHRFNLQRILYFHVPLAIVTFLAFFVVLVGSVLYLWRRSSRWDALAYSAAEIGVIFCSLTLITGSLWANAMWGRWWTWEPRLTTTLVLWLIYVSYLILRGYAPSPVQGARFSAVLGIIGFIDVPIVYFAAEWWRGLHPQPVVGPLAASGSLDSSMYLVLMVSLATFALLFAFLLWQRTSQRVSEDTLRQLSFEFRSIHNSSGRQEEDYAR